ncbi:MAG: hypothetical protein WA584_09535 [Pyrinomonadaceae bacterium]
MFLLTKKNVREGKLFEINMVAILQAITQHPFIIGFSNKANEWEAYDEGKTNSNLFMSKDLNLQIKPYSSVVEKTYLQNRLWNKDYPSPALVNCM